MKGCFSFGAGIRAQNEAQSRIYFFPKDRNISYFNSPLSHSLKEYSPERKREPRTRESSKELKTNSMETINGSWIFSRFYFPWKWKLLHFTHGHSRSSWSWKGSTFNRIHPQHTAYIIQEGSESQGQRSGRCRDYRIEHEMMRWEANSCTFEFEIIVVLLFIT